MTDNEEMEVMLLGRIMSYPKEYYDNHGLITEAIFKDSLNRKIYNQVSTRLDSGEKVDLLILSQSVKDPLAQS